MANIRSKDFLSDMERKINSIRQFASDRVFGGVTLADENTGKNDRPVNRAELNLKLITGNEPRDNYDCLQIARIVRSIRQLELKKSPSVSETQIGRASCRERVSSPV